MPAITPSSLCRLLLALCLSTGAASIAAKEMVSVNRDEINMRAGASTRHEVVWKLRRGYPLQVIARQGRWLRVRDFENDRGWVYRPLLGKSAHHVVTGNIVNIRSGPGTRYRIVGKAERAEVLRTLERRPQWVMVRQAVGPVGWVARRLLWGG
jgi:SH3-like domain-containing protein